MGGLEYVRGVNIWENEKCIVIFKTKHSVEKKSSFRWENIIKPDLKDIGYNCLVYSRSMIKE